MRNQSKEKETYPAQSKRPIDPYKTETMLEEESKRHHTMPYIPPRAL